MKNLDVNQAILTRFSPGFGGSKVPDWLKPWLEKGLGGITLFSSNCPSLEETGELVSTLRSYSPNLVISIDEEGGDVTRLFAREGSPYPSPALLGQCDDVELTYDSYFNLGRILRDLGIDMSYAPVADVVISEDNPIVGVRAFGRDYDLVARHTVAAIRGFHDAGVAACPKHFPGHGGVAEDSHHHLPTLHGNIAELQSTHLKPFVDSINAGVQAIMVGHIITPSLDPKNPASCSHAVITDYLKSELGFKGMVITDALDMGALGGTKKIAQSATRSFMAGADLLCFSGLYDQSEIINSSFQAIKKEVETGRISALLLDEEFERVRNWHPDPALKPTTNHDLNIERLSQGVEIVGDVRIRHKSVHLVEVSADPTIAAGYVAWGMRRALVNDGIKVELETSDVVLRESDPDQLIVAFRDAYRDPKLQANLNRILERYPDAIFIDMGWPSRNFEGKNVIRTFGSSAISSAIASNLLVNHEEKAISV